MCLYIVIRPPLPSPPPPQNVGFSRVNIYHKKCRSRYARVYIITICTCTRALATAAAHDHAVHTITAVRRAVYYYTRVQYVRPVLIGIVYTCVQGVPRTFTRSRSPPVSPAVSTKAVKELRSFNESFFGFVIIFIRFQDCRFVERLFCRALRPAIRPVRRFVFIDLQRFDNRFSLDKNYNIQKDRLYETVVSEFLENLKTKSHFFYRNIKI